MRWINLTEVSGEGRNDIWINIEQAGVMQRTNEDDRTVISLGGEEPIVVVAETPEEIFALLRKAVVE